MSKNSLIHKCFITAIVRITAIIIFINLFKCKFTQQEFQTKNNAHSSMYKCTALDSTACLDFAYVAELCASLSHFKQRVIVDHYFLSFFKDFANRNRHQCNMILSQFIKFCDNFINASHHKSLPNNGLQFDV